MLSLADLNPGTWYIPVVCACKGRLNLFPDLTRGRVPTNASRITSEARVETAG